MSRRQSEPETQDLRAPRAHAYENARPEVQSLVPHSAQRILDLGCSSGALGTALKQRQGAEVVGVEIDADYAADAAARLDLVVHRDLEDLFADETAISGLGRFDCLIAADVLEHLRDPWRVLRRAAGLLDNGGQAVVSLPNVRYWETFLELGLRGTWPRREQGIFDRTHLRWFTLRDAGELLGQASLQVTQVNPQYRLRPGDSSSGPQAARFARTPLRSFLTYQYVLAAVKEPRS